MILYQFFKRCNGDGTIKFSKNCIRANHISMPGKMSSIFTELSSEIAERHSIPEHILESINPRASTKILGKNGVNPSTPFPIVESNRNILKSASPLNPQGFGLCKNSALQNGFPVDDYNQKSSNMSPVKLMATSFFSYAGPSSSSEAMLRGAEPSPPINRRMPISRTTLPEPSAPFDFSQPLDHPRTGRDESPSSRDDTLRRSSGSHSMVSHAEKRHARPRAALLPRAMIFPAR